MGTLNVGPLPVVQNSTSINENMAPIRHQRFRCLVLQRDGPLPLLLIPLCSHNFGIELHVLLAAMSLGEPLILRLNLRSIGNVMAPIRVWIPLECVEMRRNIACHAWVCVLVPGSSEVRVLLVECQFPRPLF